MSIQVTINSRNLGRKITFAARGESGYVYANASKDGFCDQQIFDAQGNAETARSDSDLRKVARRYISRFVSK